MSRISRNYSFSKMNISFASVATAGLRELCGRKLHRSAAADLREAEPGLEIKSPDGVEV